MDFRIKKYEVFNDPLRYTADYLLKHEYFSVFGSKSGRDCDKFALTSLTPEERHNTVIFAEADLAFICRKQTNDEHKEITLSVL